MGHYEPEMNAARLEFLMKDKEIRRNPEATEDARRVDRAAKPPKCFGGIEAEGPRKIKFILFLNNTAIINANAVVADNNIIE